MSDLQSLTDLKSKVEKLKAKAERARGVTQQLMGELKENWDCTSLSAAETLLEGLKKEAGKASKEYKTKLQAFEKKYEKELCDAG